MNEKNKKVEKHIGEQVPFINPGSPQSNGQSSNNTSRNDSNNSSQSNNNPLKPQETQKGEKEKIIKK